MKRRIIALLAGAGLLLGGCAAASQKTQPYIQLAQAPVASEPAQAPAMNTVRIAANPSDTLNPYLLETAMNEQICPLLYDPLVKLDGHYQPREYLAQEVTLDGTRCTVRLRGGVTFSDGKPLTAADAAYSFGLCRQRDGARRYGNVSSVQVLEDGMTLEIQLYRPDIYFASLLTFPIIQADSGAQEIPPGTGRYRAVGRTLLEANDSHFEAPAAVRKVVLVPVQDVKRIGYGLISNQIDYALMEPDLTPMETAGSTPVQTNDMLYLGFNTNLYPADNEAFRRAVRLLVNRQEIEQSAYAGRAVEAYNPINPAFYQAGSFIPAQEDPNALLDSIGLDGRSADGYRMVSGRELELQLAINIESADKREAAAAIAAQLAQAHLRVTVNEYTYEDYQAQLLSGGYSLYLAQTRLPEDMDLTALLYNEGALHFLMGDTQELYALYLSARGGQTPYDAFFEAFAQQQPFVPLLFHQAVISRSRNFYSAVVATEQDIFYNIHNW